MARLSKARALELMLAYHKEDADKVFRAEFRTEWDGTRVFALLCNHGGGGMKKYVTPLADLRQYAKDNLTLAAQKAASQKVQDEKEASSELPGGTSGDVTGLETALD